MKKALEAFWSKKIDEKSLLKIKQEVEKMNWETQFKAGIQSIGIGDMTLYDHVLDWTIRLGLIPERFQQFNGLERYFAMARGKKGISALEMTKRFTNLNQLISYGIP